MQLMLRHCENDFKALETGNAMMRAGAQVLSVTDAGGAPFASKLGRFIVWAFVQDDAHCDRVDAEIAKGDK